MLAVNNNIPSNQLTTPSGLEVITIEIHCKLTVTFCVVYIPPNSNSSYHADLLTYLDSIASKSHTFILGDFNYPDINWHSLVGQSDLSNGFCDFIYRHNLYLLVSFPTHVKGNILDLILTTSPHIVNNLSPCSQSSMVGSCSDHFLLNFTVNVSLALHKKNSPKD